MEQRNLEQRWAIKFCVKLGESASVAFQKLKQAYGNILFRDEVFRWYKSFLEGRKHVEEEHRSERPSKIYENIEHVNTPCEIRPPLNIKNVE
ncbi:uncharacterized protein FLJ37770 [Trichonephila inaurata madagascariensis]|uniref:Uncharacterized protein FLJ37770 n=1 Tax=Trichonephila inaurata madagascariensis TaxID=2747483 RepID=A0A8X6IUJ7_9ARAC|nr:uncharacterized protein FLJ37770 [Trichonephila inaurata madagascariensis]